MGGLIWFVQLVERGPEAGLDAVELFLGQRLVWFALEPGMSQRP
jgi:hypothetical protein